MADVADVADPNKQAAIVQHWLEQNKAYEEEFSAWQKRCKRIIRRFRDERQQAEDGSRIGGPRYNCLWANVQTLQPAIYAKPPRPVAERRFLDRDPLARLAGMTLERALEVQIDVGHLHPMMQKAVLDYLLVGRGTVWERYEPTYGEPVDIGEGPGAEAGDAESEATESPRPVTYEKVCTDYVAWDKFAHSPAPTWQEVWWVRKEEMLTREELRARFKETDPQTGKLIADEIPLRDGSKDKQNDREKRTKQKRACIWEIWDKNNRQVVFIAPDYPNAPLEVADDPLGLQTFWPCPEPLYATMTNDCLVPIPDYDEYRDQADELDNLTARIQSLTDAVRVNGVYDSSIPELKRILSEGVDNRMIGVSKWTELASKGGIEAAMQFVPIKDVVEALIHLYEARERTKQVMYEITGISDIVRGQSSGTAKTATEQRIKGNFATLRLDDRKKAVANFACEAIRIQAEIISEQFSPEIIAEMTGMLPVITQEMANEPQPMMGHNGGPPLDAAPAVPSPAGNGATGGVPSAPGQQPPPPDPMPIFMQICELLKNDKMRTFRIDIETDSTIEVDRESEKQAVTELFTAVGGFLEKALPIGQMMPALTPALGQSLLFAFRRFGAGRDVESAWEQAIDQLTQMAKNPGPKPPSSEEIKAETEKQKQEMESQRMQMQAGIDQQKAQQDMAMAQQKQQMEIEKGQMQLQLEREKLELERQKMAMEQQKAQIGLQVEAQKAEIQSQAVERAAALDERAAIRQDELAQRADDRDAEAGERDFELGEKVAKAKAKQAMKPKPEARA